MVWFMYRKETRKYESAFDILDIPTKQVSDRIEYADPQAVDQRAKNGSANKREQGYAVRPETLPKRILWGSGDLDDILPWFVVSPRFHDFVEKFEPGVHQFVPVEIYRDTDGLPVATYYWFIVCQRIDTADREHTTFVWDGGEQREGNGYWTDSPIDMEKLEFIRIPNAKLVFNNQQVGDHHIWHEPHLLTFGNRLCSDTFAKAALAENFTGFEAVPRESVGASKGAAARGITVTRAITPYYGLSSKRALSNPIARLPSLVLPKFRNYGDTCNNP